MKHSELRLPYLDDPATWPKRKTPHMSNLLGPFGVEPGDARQVMEDEARERLRDRIAEQDAARGRPLTDSEKLANLKKALDEIGVEEAKELREALDKKIAGF